MGKNRLVQFMKIHPFALEKGVIPFLINGGKRHMREQSPPQNLMIESNHVQ